MKTYEPEFNENAKNKYTVIWLNGDGTQLDSKTYYEGQTEPTTDKTPTKAADAIYIYTFTGWDNGSVDGNVKTYAPRFSSTEKTQFTVIWLNGDGTELDRQTYREGAAEPITDQIPTKADDSGSIYVFCNSWVQESIGNVKTYTPEFAKVAINRSETDAPGIGILTNSERATKKVVLYASDSSSQIYYTLDGSTPDPSSESTILYDDSFELEKTAVVKAISIKNNSSSAVTVMKVLVLKMEELENVQSALVGETVFTNVNGEIIESVADAVASGKVEVSLNADFIDENTEISTITIMLAVYDTDGKYLGLQSRDVEVETSGILFIGTFDLPDGKEIGSIRLFTVNESIIPLLSAHTIN